MSRLLAALWLGALLVLSLGSLVLGPERAQSMDFGAILLPPSTGHWLGTDSLGRDLGWRLLYGAHISLAVGLAAVLISSCIGVALGLCAGYFGRGVDRVIMACVDVMLCFPSFFLLLAVIAFLGSSLWNIALVIGLTHWMGMTRLVRAQVLTLREREFIWAARALGAGHGRIILKHLLPNVSGILIANFILQSGSAILIESGLSFLGLGIQPPTPSWGNILMEGRSTLGAAWWLTLLPGLAIFMTVLSTNVLGNRLHGRLRGDL